MSQCTCTAAGLRADDDVAVPAAVDDEWRCPRIAVESGDRCVFHSADALADPAEAASAVLASLAATPDDDRFAVPLDPRAFDRERKRFVGARFDTLDLSAELVERTGTLPVDLRATRMNRLVLSDARIEADLDLSGARIGALDATGAVVDGDVSGTDLAVGDAFTADAATVEGALRLHDADLGGLSLDDARVGGRLECNDIRIHTDLRATECIVEGRFECKYGRVDGRIHCPGLTLRGEKRYSNTSELTFRRTAVGSHVTLEHLRSNGALLLNDLVVGGDLRLDALDLDDSLWLGAVDDESTTLGSVRVDGNLLVRNGRIGGDADLAASSGGTEPGPVIDGSVDLSGTTVEGKLTCSPRLTDDAFNVVRLHGTRVDAGVLADPPNGDPLLYDLREATLGDVELDAADGSMDGHHLVETRFDGFVFGENRAALDAADWWLHRASEGGYRDLAVASVASDAVELADDLLVAVAALDGFQAAMTAADPLAETTALVADAVDVDAIANGDETPREDALPGPFERRESDRRGLVRGIAEARANNAAADATAVLADPAVRRLVAEADPETYVRTDGEIDPGRSAIRGDLHSAIATRIADRERAVPGTDALVTTYLLAKNGANRVGDAGAASQFFRNEMRCRRRSHGEALRDTETVRGYLRGAYDVSSNVLFDVSSGYGEQPRRVLTFSGGVVLGFAGVFALLLSTPPYGGSIGYVLMSLESFVALILGGATEQTDPFVRLVATIEGFIGAFLIALFVFTLTRSVDR